MTDSLLFFKRLPKHNMELVDLIVREDLFLPVPTNWHVIVVDVENSTQAVKNGLHHDVNLTATGSIIAVLNKLKTRKKKIVIPYFFGGDGATFIVPEQVLKEVLNVLENYRHHVRQNLFLSLRVGSLPVTTVYKEGHTIRILIHEANASLRTPIVLGNGLRAAEKMIKSFFIDETIMPQQILPVDLEGMECRWQEIKSPAENDKIICLVINCPEEKEQGKVYHQVLKSISRVFGNYEERHPISTNKLKLDSTLQKMRKEMYARIGKNNLFYLLKNWLITILGKFYFANFKEGKAYLEKVHELSYTTMVDGALSMVLSGTQEEADEFLKDLNVLEAEKKIMYGVHITHASIMSCYVQDRKSNHIHFIDGTEGGYTTAAKMYKAKLAGTYG